MENTLKSNLILPSMAYELDREEMSYVEGGGTYCESTTYTNIGAFIVDFWGYGAYSCSSVAAFLGLAVTDALAKMSMSVIIGMVGAMLGLCAGAWLLINLEETLTQLSQKGSFTVYSKGITIFGAKIELIKYVGA